MYCSINQSAKARQDSMERSLRSTLQRASLIWKKEVSTLERIINYFDQSGEKVELAWDNFKMFYEGTVELTLGKHSGSLFISDQPGEGPLFEVFSFEVNRKGLGVVQEILLKIGSDKAAPTLERISSQEITSPSSNNVLIQSPVGDCDEVETVALSSSLGLAKKEKDQLEDEKRILMGECARVKQEKQKIKEESFEIDEQLICAMEQLSAFERQQALMEERHNALLREARLLEEDNLAMNAVINEKDIKSAQDCETIRQLKIDIEFNNDRIERMRGEKDRFVAKCNELEQRCAMNEHLEVFRTEELDQKKEKERIEKEMAIFRSDREKLREKDIPSLIQDNEELQQQNKATSERFQNELHLVKKDRDHLEKELQMIRAFLNLDKEEKKKIDKSPEPETRDSMKLIGQLSLHFEECSHSLKKLVQLLEANVVAKENQLGRRSKELRDARNRNDSLVQEVFSRGQEIAQLTERLKTMMTTPENGTSQSEIFSTLETEPISEVSTKLRNDFNPPSVLAPISDSTDYIPAKLPSSSNLAAYKPGIKTMYRGLPNVTNKVIDFQNSPIQVMNMTFLEDSKSHVGRQVICMLEENYTVGTLMTVFQYRPSMSGLGMLQPITYGGIQFENAVGESDGTFKGTTYFRCPALHAAFISVDYIYIRV